MPLVLSHAKCDSVRDFADADVELTANKSNDAVDFGGSDPEAIDEVFSRARDDGEPRAGDPTGRGRAVDLVESGKLVDRQAVDMVLAQHVALAIGELGEGGG